MFPVRKGGSGLDADNARKRVIFQIRSTRILTLVFSDSILAHPEVYKSPSWRGARGTGH